MLVKRISVIPDGLLSTMYILNYIKICPVVSEQTSCKHTLTHKYTQGELKILLVFSISLFHKNMKYISKTYSSTYSQYHHHHPSVYTYRAVPNFLSPMIIQINRAQNRVNPKRDLGIRYYLPTLWDSWYRGFAGPSRLRPSKQAYRGSKF